MPAPGKSSATSASRMPEVTPLWTISPPKGAALASLSSKCSGLRSPVIAVKRSTSGVELRRRRSATAPISRMQHPQAVQIPVENVDLAGHLE